MDHANRKNTMHRKVYSPDPDGPIIAVRDPAISSPLT